LAEYVATSKQRKMVIVLITFEDICKGYKIRYTLTTLKEGHRIFDIH